MNVRDTESELWAMAQLAATKAAPLFHLFGWTYLDQPTPPTQNQIFDMIWRLIPNAEKYGETSCGRFTVRCSYNEDGTQEWSISLELAEAYNIPSSVTQTVRR